MLAGLCGCPWVLFALRSVSSLPFLDVAFSVLSVPNCRSVYYFGGGLFCPSGNDRRCGLSPRVPLPGAPGRAGPQLPALLPPAPFGRALRASGRAVFTSFTPFFSATRSCPCVDVLSHIINQHRASLFLSLHICIERLITQSRCQSCDGQHLQEYVGA